MDLPDTLIEVLREKVRIRQEMNARVEANPTGAISEDDRDLYCLSVLDAQEALLREQERTRHMGRGNGGQT